MKWSKINKEQSKAGKKATLLVKDLDKLQLKEKQVGQAIIVMEVYWIHGGGKKSDLNFAIKGNALKRKNWSSKRGYSSFRGDCWAGGKEQKVLLKIFHIFFSYIFIFNVPITQLSVFALFISA